MVSILGCVFYIKIQNKLQEALISAYNIMHLNGVTYLKCTLYTYSGYVYRT